MNIASLSLPTTHNSLKALMVAAYPNKVIPDEVEILIIQAPAANANILYFGDSAEQPFELEAKDPFYYVPADVAGGRINLNNIHVKGTSPDKVSATWIGFGKDS